MMADIMESTMALKPIELEAVYAISKVVSETVDTDKALDQIIKISRQVFIFDNAAIYLHNKNEDPEPFFARAIGRGKSSAYDLPWGETAAKKTISSGEIFTQEVGVTSKSNRLEQQFYLGLPMLISGEITGAIIFIRFGGPPYIKDHINLAQFITTHVSQLFEHKRLVTKIASLEADRRLARMQDDFIAMVSHELKTPLGFIKGYTTTLLRKDTEWEKDTQQEFLEIIDEEADRLSELIENMLDSYRLKSGTIKMDPKITPLEPFFHSILDRLSSQETNLDIHFEIVPPEISIRADSKRLAQVVDNIISNASKYAPNSTLSIQAYQKESSVNISISDNGPGIPPEHLDHLFNRFYRVPERSAGVRGTGLGLFICKQIIEAHEGSISVESKLNEGTKFHIILPAIEEYFSREEEI